jgi:hypothetical protein
MLRSLRWIAPALALCALAMFSNRLVRAQDAPASQPSSGNCSVVVTVLDSDSKPVSKASVKIYEKRKKSNADGSSTRPKAFATGKTDEDGKFTFSGLANGDYKINASFRKTGAKGSETVSVTDDAPNASITINLAVPDSGTAGATTAPSPQ